MHSNKFTGRCVAAVLSLLLLAGCSGNQNITSPESGDAAANNNTSPKIPASEISAVLLLPSDPADGACMSSAHSNAFFAAASELDIRSSAVASADPGIVSEITDGNNVIFGAGYDFMNPLDKDSKENADKLYACFGGYKYNTTNYTNYYSAVYEAQYLAGIAAGTNSVTGKIGIISEFSTEYPDSAAEINSFALGVIAANPTAQIYVYSLGSRTNTLKAEEYTKKLLAMECDVISIQCDTSAPAKVVSESEKEAMFIGYGIDMANIGDGKCLTSVVWNLKDYYKAALTAASGGSWITDGNYNGSISDGAVTLATLSDKAQAITQSRIDSASQLIRENLLDVFSNRKVVFDAEGKPSVTNSHLKDNKGNTMISEDGSSCYIYGSGGLSPIDPSAATSDKLASSIMNYLVEGVTLVN